MWECRNRMSGKKGPDEREDIEHMRAMSNQSFSFSNDGPATSCSLVPHFSLPVAAIKGGRCLSFCMRSQTAYRGQELGEPHRVLFGVKKKNRCPRPKKKNAFLWFFSYLRRLLSTFSWTRTRRRRSFVSENKATETKGRRGRRGRDARKE